jgi:hypothetical protein
MPYTPTMTSKSQNTQQQQQHHHQHHHMHTTDLSHLLLLPLEPPPIARLRSPNWAMASSALLCADAADADGDDDED